MNWLLKLIPPEQLIKVLTEYLSGLLAGTIKDPSSEKAKILFIALDNLALLISKILEKRASAILQSKLTGTDSPWSV